jgi:hypothetical protein
MAISKQRTPVTQLNTVQTNILPVVNTSGVDLGAMLFCNTHPSNTVQLYVSIVPTGGTMASGNGIVWNVPIGASGLLNISVPAFLASGDTLAASGSAAGLTMYSSYLKLN